MDNYYLNHKEEVKQRSRDRYHDKKEEIQCKQKEYYIKNKETIKQKGKEYTEKNKEKYLKYQAEYRKKNKEKATIYFRDRYKNNKKKLIQENVVRKFKRYHSDIDYRLRVSLSSRIRSALRNDWKDTSTTILIGCSLSFLRQHLESQFKDGMSWDNYGFYGWHIDHIRPCVSFDLSKLEEQFKCFNWKNLQPLWALENIAKSDKII